MFWLVVPLVAEKMAPLLVQDCPFRLLVGAPDPHVGVCKVVPVKVFPTGAVVKRA